VIIRLSADLTLVQSVICRTNVFYDEAPFARPLTVVDADARVADESKQADCQRVNVVMTTPRDLRHVTYVT